VDPIEGLKAFGQKDHVRRYGPDFADRLREAGFTVNVVPIRTSLRPDSSTERSPLRFAPSPFRFPA
jgi:hypothetical protein